MARVAVIEDDVPTSTQLRGWIEAARPGTLVDQWFNRDEAIAALDRERYDLVVLDIELGRERNAGVAVINEINKRGTTPVLVVPLVARYFAPPAVQPRRTNSFTDAVIAALGFNM